MRSSDLEGFDNIKGRLKTTNTILGLQLFIKKSVLQSVLVVSSTRYLELLP